MRQRQSPFARIAAAVGLTADHREVAVGALAGLAVMAAGMVLALANTVLLGRWLGPEGFGIYSLALAIVTTLFMVLFAGLSTLLLRETAVHTAARRHAQAGFVLRRALILSAMAALAACCLLLGAIWLSSPAHPEMTTTLALAALILPLAALALMQAGALRGLGHVVAGLAPDLIVRPGLLLALMLAYAGLAGTGALTSSLAMALHVAACAVALIVSSVWLYRVWPAADAISAAAVGARSSFSGLLPLTLVAGLQAANANVDVLALGVLAGERDVGVYRVAWQLALVIATAIAAMQVVLQPRIAALYAEGRKGELQSMLRLATRGILAMALVAALLFMAAGEIVIGAVVGADYAAGATVLAILSGGQIVSAAAAASLPILNMTHNEWDTAAGLGIGFLAALLLNVLLIPLFGINGAAAASAVSLVAMHAFLAWRVRQRTGLAGTALGL